MTGKTEKEVIIRPMTQEDVDIIMAMDKNTSGEDRCITFTRPVNIDQLVQEKAFGFVAETEGRMVGFLTGVIRKYPNGTDAAWIHITGVHPEYRHWRIGTRLAQALFEHCRQQGIKSVRINVNWGDASLLTWLGALGFGVSLGRTVEFERIL